MVTNFSFESKLIRSEQHLRELGPEIRRWVQSRPYRIIDELDPDTGDNVISGQLRESPPPLIPQLTGDCLQNLRSCLDHLACALAVANKGALTDEEAMKVEFPIFRYVGHFQKHGMSQIKHLSVGAQTIIDKLQPCHTRNPTSHLLWFLHMLNNIDKHRRVLLTTVMSLGAGVTQPPGAVMPFFTLSNDAGSSETITELARYRCVDPKDDNRLKVGFHPTLIMLFGDISTEERIVNILLVWCPINNFTESLELGED
jgi:hypothetical protein